jgi:hypothetical protein
MECTTSANRTVTCLYSAAWALWVTGFPHSLQNFAIAENRLPQDWQDSSAVTV